MVWSDITSLWGGQDTGTADVTLAHCLVLALTPAPTPGIDFGPSMTLTHPVLTRLPGWGPLRVWEFTEVLLTE